MTVYKWESVKREQMSPKFVRQVIHGQKMTIARINLSAGATVPEHSHANEQISMLQEGKLRFVLSGEERILVGGEILHIPPGAPHSVEALEDSLVMDLFSPAREDWIRGDDAYLRR